MDLQAFFRENPRAALGFSGGVDSALLLWAGVTYGEQVRPYFVKTAFQPQFELEDARRLCRELGVELTSSNWTFWRRPAWRKTPGTGATTASGPCSPPCGTGPGGRFLPAAGRHQRLRRRRGPAGDAGHLGTFRPLPPAGVRPDQRPGPGPVQRGGAVHLGQAPPTPAWPPVSPPGRPSRRRSWNRWSGPRTPCSPWATGTSGCGCSTGPARLQLREDQLQRAAGEAGKLRQALGPWFQTVLLDLAPR